MLEHNFMLLEKDSFNSLIENFRKSNFFFEPLIFDELKISDKIILLSMPLWKQLTAWNYKNEKEIQGLAYHGITVFHPDQLMLVKELFSKSLVDFSKIISIFNRRKFKLEINNFLFFLQKGIDRNMYLVHEGI